MIQQINLYAKLDMQQTALVVLPFVVGGWLLIILVYGAFAGMEFYSQQKQLGFVQTLEAANEAVRLKIAEKPNVDYANELQNENVQVALVNKERIVKAKLIALLKRSQHGTKVPFSEYLDGLASQHIQGVALAKISYKGSAIGGSSEFIMAGNASKAEKVPLYLERLGAVAAFDGMAFKKVIIAEAEADDEVSFEVTSWTEI
ncbi:MAG: hypothetical protein ACJAVI_000610 [Candidatus Azotimanducaceae bacterium]|jgi:hypothetical protein